MRNVRFLVAAILVATGLVVAVVSVVAIFDPVGTQYANDADPFGSPPSIIRAIVLLLAGCAVALGGVRILRRTKAQ